VRLLLIRHGQSEGNAAGLLQGQGEYPLSELGRQQSLCLARRLNREYSGLAAIYTSPQSRAVQTAAILAESTGAPVIADDRLCEYDAGELTGLTMEDVRERFPGVYAAWMADGDEWVSLPGSEGNESLQRRVREVFAEITARHEGDETAAVVSHGGTLGAYLAQAIGVLPERRHPFHFANASLTVVDLSRRRLRLIQHNDTCHLSDIGGRG
jgi:broad specificity phosphatase PhoE